MAEFITNWTFRDPMRTIEFRAGSVTVDAQVIAAADKAGVLVKEEDNGDGNYDRPTARSPKGRTVNLKG